jgi:ribose transport system ATP-binding protein
MIPRQEGSPPYKGAGAAPLLEVSGATKRYGANVVLSAVDFTVDAGDSIALIGENGAGKSTFAKIITGVTRPDAGAIRMNGKPVSFNSPRDALAHGIAFIPQELAYVPHLSVAENILLGHWPNRHGLTSRTMSLRQARDECRRFGVELDVARPMASLKLADRQIVEIVKALARRACLIVLDEPTASLSEQESGALYKILGRLTHEGVGVIYISHRMDEVFRFSSRVVVFRNGELVASVAPSEATPAQLIAHMLGQEKEDFSQIQHAPGRSERPAAELRGWTRPGVPALAKLTISVEKGEIVGVYGLRGSGTELVAEGLAGLHPEIGGELVLDGHVGKVMATPLAARRAGIAYVPAERKRDGLILQLPISANLTLLTLRQISRFGWIQRRIEQSRTRDLAHRFAVRYSRLGQAMRQLSGGNQQKVLLASRMAANPKLLVLQEPTRGVDIGARVELHRLLTEIANKGCAMLLVTSDVEEAVAVSHRLLIMREGAIVGELSGTNKTQARAVAFAAGSTELT